MEKRANYKSNLRNTLLCVDTKKKIAYFIQIIESAKC